MNSAYIWSSFIVVFLNILSIEGNKIFSVIDYGANPNDNLDDSAAIQAAINAAIRYGLPSIADFPAGNYTVASTITIVNATNLTVKGVGSDQTFLIGTNPVSIFFAQRCHGLKFTLFSIDYDPLPFTAGYVVDVHEKYIDVQIVPPHQANINQKVQAILRYDPGNMRPAFGSNTYEIYQTPPADVNTSLVSPGVLRLPLANPARFTKNDPIVARYAFTQHSMNGMDLTDITVQSIVIYAAWEMGFPILRARRLNINDYHVKRRNGRWMSTTMDCMHYTDAREYISLTDSSCEAMGDDGLNVHGALLEITKVIDSKTIIMQTNWGDLLDVGVGTHLEFTSHQQPFTVHGNGTVASLVFNTVNSRKVSFTDPVTVNVGDWACVSDTPYVFIRNFTVSHNRARGVLLESRNIDIQQSIFNQTSGPAILIQPSLYWKEAPEARNVSLSRNLYLHNNEGIAQEGGIITILPDPPQLVPVINDIRIEQSTFDFGQHSQGLLQSDNGNNIFISGNYIAVDHSEPLVLICNSRNISANNNCVVNTSGKKIDRYYTFDTTGPCSTHLSSLIDLPRSAFNSSFPPPVVLTS